MKCSFCGEQIKEGTGMTYVLKTGRRYYFCSSKCEKNLLKLGRKPASAKWTAFHREGKKVSSEKGKAEEGKAVVQGEENKAEKSEVKGKK